MTTTISDTAAQAAIGAATRELRLPIVRNESVRLAELAQRGQHTYLGYLAEVLCAEIDERDIRRRQRLIKEARFPRIKRIVSAKNCNTNALIFFAHFFSKIEA